MRQDLTNLDRDIDQPLSRIFQEAFAHGFDCQILQGGVLAGQTALQSVFTAALVQNCILGSKLRLKDGREFMYSQGGGVQLEKALMCQTAVQVSNYALEVQTGYGLALDAIEGTVLITTGALPAANLFKDGQMVVNSGTGIGESYPILTNTSHLTLPYLTFGEAIRAAIAAADEVTLVLNPFKNTLVAPVTTPTGVAVGVPRCQVPIGYFYWSQTKGIAPLTVDTGETLVVGEPVGLADSGTVPGACGTIVSSPAVAALTKLEGSYGKVLDISAADKTALVHLDLGW